MTSISSLEREVQNSGYASSIQSAATPDAAKSAEFRTEAPGNSVHGVTKSSVAGLLSSSTASTMITIGQQYNQMDNAATTTTVTSPTETMASSVATNKFKDYMDKSPEERYVSDKIAQKGYTQEEFEALPLEEQQQIASEIQEEMIQATENALNPSTEQK